MSRKRPTIAEQDAMRGGRGGALIQMCGARRSADSGDVAYCTRAKGHSGEHISAGLSHINARWQRTLEEVAKDAYERRQRRNAYRRARRAGLGRRAPSLDPLPPRGGGR